MGSSTSVTIENSEPPGKGEASRSKGIPVATTADIDAAYSDERPSRTHWPSEAPPTGVLTGVLGELAFYYGACCLYHRSAPPRRGKMR
jgi:hypothetical protein